MHRANVVKYTVGKCMIALNRYDDKKSVEADGIKRLAR